ncbi:unnamed protein product, partial [Meganyctiphanes norvegica]
MYSFCITKAVHLSTVYIDILIIIKKTHFSERLILCHFSLNNFYNIEVSVGLFEFIQCAAGFRAVLLASTISNSLLGKRLNNILTAYTSRCIICGLHYNLTAKTKCIRYTFVNLSPGSDPFVSQEWNGTRYHFVEMAADPEKRQTFVDSVCELLERYGFDGLDFDWEYPGARGGNSEDHDNFIKLLDMLRARFDQYQPPKILTGALAAGRQNIDQSYDPEGLQRNMDLFHIMAYDYHGAFENFTHHNAPLCQYPLDEGNMTWFNVEYTIKYYLSLGFAPEKMAMGIPTYGRCWTLDDPEQNGMLAPANKPSPGGNYTMTPGSIGFNEICSRMTTNKTEGDCTIVHDPDLHEPYFYCKSDNIWCGYDDGDSIYLKAKMARNLGLGGVMVWTIDTDDFLGECYDETFHLIKHAKDPWKEPIDSDYEACAPYSPTTTSSSTTPSETTPSETTPSATTPSETTPSETTPSATTPFKTTHSSTTTASTTTPTSTSAPTGPTTTTTSGPCPPDFGAKPNCALEPEGSVFAHPDCIKYWECEFGGATIKMCGPGTVFDDVISECNFEYNVVTTCCRLWDCALDNTYYPAADCDKYYRCYNGAPHLEQCADCLFWDQGIFQCDTYGDSSHCIVPDYC